MYPTVLYSTCSVLHCLTSKIQILIKCWKKIRQNYKSSTVYSTLQQELTACYEKICKEAVQLQVLSSDNV
jgi:hypothetical protein